MTRSRAAGDGAIPRRRGPPDAAHVAPDLPRRRQIGFARVLGAILRIGGWSSLVVVAAICVLPIVVIVLGSFSEGNPFNDFHASLEPWRRAAESSRTLNSIGYSFLLSLRVPLGLAISFVVAWYLARNDVIGKRAIMYTLWLAF